MQTVITTHQVKFRSSFWNTRSKKGRSSRPCSFLSILKTRNVALGRCQCTLLLGWNASHQACTGGLTSPKFHSYAGIWPSGFMYHSRVSRSSCFLANEGSTTANGIQWNAVSHAAKNGYSHLNRIVRKTEGDGRDHNSLVWHGKDVRDVHVWPVLWQGSAPRPCSQKPRPPCFGRVFVRGEVAVGVDLR